MSIDLFAGVVASCSIVVHDDILGKQVKKNAQVVEIGSVQDESPEQDDGKGLAGTLEEDEGGGSEDCGIRRREISLHGTINAETKFK